MGGAVMGGHGMGEDVVGEYGAGPHGTLLQVNDLHVEIATRRGIVRAVDGVSLEVPAGEAVGLVGESGSGKSMTLRAIIGVLPPEARVVSGQIMLDGVDHLVFQPREMYFDFGFGGIQSLGILDNQNAWQIVLLRDPVMLPRPAEIA